MASILKIRTPRHNIYNKPEIEIRNPQNERNGPLALT